MTKLDQIARALAARHGMTAWEALDESDRVGFRLDAVAALEVLREPSDMMRDELNKWACCIGQIDKGWVAAIDAALKEDT